MRGQVDYGDSHELVWVSVSIFFVKVYVILLCGYLVPTPVVLYMPPTVRSDALSMLCKNPFPPTLMQNASLNVNNFPIW